MVSFKVKMLYTVIWICCFQLVVGCFTLRMNVRTWSKDNIEAFGSLDSKGRARYYSIRIGTEAVPYDGGATFVIRLNKNIILRSSDLSEPTMRRNALSVAKPCARRVMTQCADGTRIYSFDGARFLYREDRLVSFDISLVTLPGEKLIPEIAGTEGDVFSTFPISEDILQRIFGSPDKTSDTLVW